ncbi:MAG: hypothetical protein AAB389_04710 [Patescibacteria group bacterium]
MKIAVVGRWNRHSSSRPETKKLWKLRNLYEKGEADITEVLSAEHLVSRRILQELEEAGADILSDVGIGQDSVYDHAHDLDGCAGFSTLVRIPETNQFHRQPEIKGELDTKRPTSAYYDLNDARVITKKPLMVCFPGPYSLAKQTKTDKPLEETTIEYAKVMNVRIKQAILNGAAWVRIEEPQISGYHYNWSDFYGAHKVMMDGVDKSKVILAVWYNFLHIGYLAAPEFDNFWLDFVDSEKNFENLQNLPKGKKLFAGIMNARQPYLETDEELGHKLNKIEQYVDREDIFLCANTDLHFLPWDDAIAKVERLVEFRDRLEDMTFAAPAKMVTPETSKVWRPKLIFPTSAVGSFPQPEDLRKARAKVRKVEMHPEDCEEIAIEHTRRWIEIQDKLDITVPVDGEFRREDMAVYFGVGFGGKLGDFVPSYENRRYRPVIYSDRVYRSHDITVSEFCCAQARAGNRPVKATITGPATLADWGLLKNSYYLQNPRDFRMDLARELNHEIGDLMKTGLLKILQVDEPALTTKEKNLDIDLEAIAEAVRGYEDKVYLILHICYSTMEALDRAWPKIIKLPFHQIHMETANRDYELLKIVDRHGFGGKDIGLGVLDVHTDRIETQEEILSGVQKALKYFKPAQIWLTPDCGLKERSEEVSKAKLKVMAEAAKILRK